MKIGSNLGSMARQWVGKWNEIRPELKTRIKTGVIGAAVLLGVTLGFGSIGTSFVAITIALVMTHEFLGMVLSLPDRHEKRQIVLGVVWLVGFFSAFGMRMEFELLLLVFVGLFLYFLFTAYRHGATSQALESHLREAVYCFFGVFYLGFLPLFLPRIREQESGALWLLVFFLINWVGDSAAYFVGMKRGKSKLYPQISPKKTWEGAWGGLAGGFIVTLLFKAVAFRTMPWAFVIAGPVIVGAAAQAGDLCESFIKRAFDRKDSGQLLPGHGGFMDRFDGLVMSAPFMYFCVRTLG